MAFTDWLLRFFSKPSEKVEEAPLYDDRGISLPLDFKDLKRTNILVVFGPSQLSIKTYATSFIKQLDGERFQIFAAGPKGAILDELKHMGITTFLVDIPQGLHLIRDFKVVSKLKKILNKDEIVMVDAHGYKASLVSGLAARAAKTPIVLFNLHNFIIDEGAGRFKHLFFDITERILPSMADKIIAASAALRRRVLDKGKAESSKVLMIHTGIKLSSPTSSSSKRFSSAADLLALKTGAPIVVTVGTLTPQKGVKYLLNAATHVLRDMPNVQFLIIGDGPSRHELEIIAEKFGIHKRVTFTGWRDDSADIIAHSDVFVSPALTEGFPPMILEAMSAGKPVVATAVGGTPEVVVDRENGFLVPPRKPMPMAQAILFLLSNKEAAIQMGLAGRRRTEEEFDLKKTIKATNVLYNELIENWEETEKRKAEMESEESS